MNPHIEQKSKKGDMLSFTLSGVNVSVANAIRRTILSDIPTVVFKTSPYEECKATIFTNTTRFPTFGFLLFRNTTVSIYLIEYILRI
jgi:hypothetical protein